MNPHGDISAGVDHSMTKYWALGREGHSEDQEISEALCEFSFTVKPPVVGAWEVDPTIVWRMAGTQTRCLDSFIED